VNNLTNASPVPFGGQNFSPYALVGARLVDMGYSAIPVAPRSKCPGVWSSGNWRVMADWTRFCGRLPTDIETSLWDRWPDAGVCVALGRGRVAIDVDTDDSEIQAAIAEVVGLSPVEKAGHKGYTAFFRASPAVKSASFRIGDKPAFDLLAHGRQTVIPPTIHPQTGRAYEWLGGHTLETITVDKLPELPDDVAARLAEALKPFGYRVPVEPQASERTNGDGDCIWRETNNAALAKIEAWASDLGAQRQGDSWRLVATWRGGENTNVSIHPAGIKDFVTDERFTPIDLLMRALSYDNSTALTWLRDKLRLDPPPIDVKARPKVADGMPPKRDPATPERPYIASENGKRTEEFERHQERAGGAPPAPQTKCDPFDPKTAGGLLQQMAEWIFSSSIKPSRELSMLAAVAVMSAFAGRRYVGPTGLASNLYLCGIARTGAGKDALLSAVKNILRSAKMKKLLGSDDPTSEATPIDSRP
jgi:hypothetical protein